jgi:predicted nucleotidyltransferase
MVERQKGPSATPALALDNPVLAEMVDRLVRTYRPERIFLFGSAARGDAGPDSDYDLMVVVADNSPPELRRSRAGYRALRPLGVPRDIIVSTSTDFRRQLHLKASFPSPVVREGKLLYGVCGASDARGSRSQCSGTRDAVRSGEAAHARGSEPSGIVIYRPSGPTQLEAPGLTGASPPGTA